jgi:hypothetical protein
MVGMVGRSQGVTCMVNDVWLTLSVCVFVCIGCSSKL